MNKRKPIECLLDYKSKGYEIGDQIGEGGFGKVFLCQKLDQPGSVFAMKIIQMSANQEQMNEIMKDAEILKKFNHRNIIRYIDSFFVTEKYFCIISEYA